MGRHIGVCKPSVQHPNPQKRSTQSTSIPLRAPRRPVGSHALRHLLPFGQRHRSAPAASAGRHRSLVDVALQGPDSHVQEREPRFKVFDAFHNPSLSASFPRPTEQAQHVQQFEWVAVFLRLSLDTSAMPTPPFRRQLRFAFQSRPTIQIKQRTVR